MLKKVSIAGLDKAFDHRTRLGIMALLLVNEWVDFTELRDTLGVSDGSLASHIKALEQKELIEVRKRFEDRKPRTSYRVTEAGQKAFNDHLDQLEQLINLREN